MIITFDRLASSGQLDLEVASVQKLTISLESFLSCCFVCEDDMAVSDVFGGVLIPRQIDSPGMRIVYSTSPDSSKKVLMVDSVVS